MTITIEKFTAKRKAMAKTKILHGLLIYNGGSESILKNGDSFKSKELQSSNTSFTGSQDLNCD